MKGGGIMERIEFEVIDEKDDCGAALVCGH